MPGCLLVTQGWAMAGRPHQIEIASSGIENQKGMRHAHVENVEASKVARQRPIT